MAERKNDARDNIYSFPYEPYDIQLGFMTSLYNALEAGGIGLFESPTGTGKTLSLICACLTWLQERKKENDTKSIENSNDESVKIIEDVPEWIQDHALKVEEDRRRVEDEDRARRIAKAKAHLLGKNTSNSDRNSNFDIEKEEENDFLINNEWEEDKNSGKRCLSSDSDMDSEEELMDILRANDLQAQDVPNRLQVIFCSRTHSQLTQFVGEIHRTKFSDLMSLVSLGSRQSLCINDEVRRLRAPGLINEKCLELQKPQKSRKKIAGNNQLSARAKRQTNVNKCPYLAVPGTKAAQKIKDMILAVPADIEELEKLGRRRDVCPYYAARHSVPDADVILAPYSSLLVKETRDSLGLNVRGNIIVIDEAHNLVDAINASHSTDISIRGTLTAKKQLETYFERFRKQLAPNNARNIQALQTAAVALSNMISNVPNQAREVEKSSQVAAVSLTVNEFLRKAGLDDINMFQLVRYARESKAVFKIAGFWQSQLQRQEDNNNTKTIGEEASLTGSLHNLMAFLQTLTNDDGDGRIILDYKTSMIRYIALNAAACFNSVVSEAHAVILASGTLSPLESVLHLFPKIPKDKIHHYNCGHVVGKDRLITIPVGRGPTGKVLDFRHEYRSSLEVKDELGRILVNVCKAIHGGVVVFFPSFDYIDMIYQRWNKTGALASLSKTKRIFLEPRSSGKVEALLEEYAECIKNQGSNTEIKQKDRNSTANATYVSGYTKTGGLILCVVGGKLAEGINFGDDLGRLVVMVGLPYPNPQDPELQERLKFIDRQQDDRYSKASREHYVNLCMKAVNQCIGRAIRHRRDYATVMLVDIRYSEGFTNSQLMGPLSKLPVWIQNTLIKTMSFGDAYKTLIQFQKKVKNQEHDS